ncbi:hypothetical protein J6590_000993 [Homalodisca vitripennis]|nr:hypothetical protein J6590_000993 [Homalodisca vitripennis]
MESHCTADATWLPMVHWHVVSHEKLTLHLQTLLVTNGALARRVTRETNTSPRAINLWINHQGVALYSRRFLVTNGALRIRVTRVANFSSDSIGLRNSERTPLSPTTYYVCGLCHTRTVEDVQDGGGANRYRQGMPELLILARPYSSSRT